MMPQPSANQSWPDVLMDVFMRVGLVVLLAAFCWRVFHPFLNLMLWSIILAITLYPLQEKIRARFDLSDGRTATLIVVAAILILAAPVWMIGNSLVDSALDGLKTFERGQLHVPAPKPEVAQWPVVGEKVHAAWTQAAADPTQLLERLGPKVKAAGTKLFGMMAGMFTAFMLFLVALPIAGIFMAWGKEAHAAADRVSGWLFGPTHGPEFTGLCAATVRSVAQGVIGVAFIQMLLIGVGMVLIGMPGAGFLSIIVLFLGIVQVPATVVTIPVLIYVFSTQEATAGTIVLGIYLFVAGLADNVLKPLLLGRGVAVPMPVILVGALGGMVSDGLLGLFIGPVVLGMFYQLFWRWVDQHAPAIAPAAAAPAVAAEPAKP